MSGNEFIYPRSRYYGEFTPTNLVFDANLQEFSQRVSYIVALESGGKLQPSEAFAKLRELWLELERSKEQLGF